MNDRQALPWQDAPYTEMARLAWPMTVSMLSFGMMTLVDTVFVSRLGVAEIAGVGLAGTSTFLVVCFFMGMLRSLKVLVAQALGAGRPSELDAFLAAGLVVAIVSGVFVIGAGQIVGAALEHLAASPEAGVHARTYLTIRVVSAPALLCFVALRERRYGAGDSRSSMIATVLSNVVNLGLNALFVLVLGWGVAGSAWATVAAQTVELVLLLGISNPLTVVRSFAVLERRHLVALLRVGAPTGLQFVLESASFALLATIVSTMGELQMAAHQIVLQIVHLTVLPTVALGESCSVLAGQAVGAGQPSLVRALTRQGLFVVAVYAAVCTAIMVGMGASIASVFSSDPALVAVTIALLRVAGTFQLSDGATSIVRGTLRGTGDVTYPAMVGVVCAWVCTPPIAWLFGKMLELGAAGAWSGLTLEMTVLAVLCWRRIVREDWRAAYPSLSRDPAAAVT